MDIVKHKTLGSSGNIRCVITVDIVRICIMQAVSKVLRTILKKMFPYILNNYKIKYKYIDITIRVYIITYSYLSLFEGRHHN